MSGTLDTDTIVKNDVDVSSLLGKPYNVILFNDEHNPYLLVVLQVQRATKCSLEKAESITNEAHVKGEAIAFTGHKERCELVDMILSGQPLNLSTDIRSC
jgi:ATP-dependent Clp protease adapter protein ClpS